MTVASAGIVVSGPPTEDIFPAVMNTVPLSIRPPSPSKMVTPVMAVGVDG